MAANDHQIRRLHAMPQRPHLHFAAGFDDFRMPADRHEAVGATERRDRAGAFAHRVSDQAAFGPNEKDKQILRAADFAVYLDGQLGDNRVSPLRRQARQLALRVLSRDDATS